MSYDLLDGFRDIEPEDAWDPGDTIPELINNLVRRTEALTRRRMRIGPTEPDAVLDALEEVVRRARRKRLYGRDLVRADQLDEDVVFVRSRL